MTGQVRSELRILLPRLGPVVGPAVLALAGPLGTGTVVSISVLLTPSFSEVVRTITTMEREICIQIKGHDDQSVLEVTTWSVSDSTVIEHSSDTLQLLFARQAHNRLPEPFAFLAESDSRCTST